MISSKLLALVRIDLLWVNGRSIWHNVKNSARGIENIFFPSNPRRENNGRV